MQFIVDDKRLEELAKWINPIPTVYGGPIALLLSTWQQEAQAKELPPNPFPSAPGGTDPV